jgi:hypothetical protein
MQLLIAAAAATADASDRMHTSTSTPRGLRQQALAAATEVGGRQDEGAEVGRAASSSGSGVHKEQPNDLPHDESVALAPSAAPAAASASSSAAPAPPLWPSLAPSLQACWLSGESIIVRLDDPITRQPIYAVKCAFARITIEVEQRSFLQLAQRCRRVAGGPALCMRRLRQDVQLSTADVDYVRGKLRLYRKSIRSKVQRAHSGVQSMSDDALVEHVLQQRLVFDWYDHTLRDGLPSDSLPAPSMHSVRVGLGLVAFPPPPRGQSEGEASQRRRQVTVLRWILGCFSAVQQHHKVGFLLGDVKPHNIFLQSTYDTFSREWRLHPVIGDYGLAQCVSRTEVGGDDGFVVPIGAGYGTEAYAGPEI